ncbi:MAG: NADP-dependent oxidoreductase [Rubrivivax sp.]
MKNRQIHFVRRPDGNPAPDVFGEREVDIGAPGDGELLCRNLTISIDPYLRLKMYDRRSYTPPLQIGETIPGRTIAQVLESRAPGFAPGDHVMSFGGWQQYAVVRGKTAQKVDLAAASAGAWLGPLGMTGMTAYAGLMHIGKPRAGETLVVSGAAGAVGGLVGQIGRIHGCRVVGIAGSDEKCRAVVEQLRFDACLNYREPGLTSRLESACSKGADIYFDNVGGEISRTVSSIFNDFGRHIVCGLISQYSGQQPSEPTAFDEFMRLVLTRKLTVRGFIVSDIEHEYPEFEQKMAGWIRDGQIVHREHVHRGFEQIVPAFLGMLAGENAGKSIVHIA